MKQSPIWVNVGWIIAFGLLGAAATYFTALFYEATLHQLAINDVLQTSINSVYRGE